MQIPNPLRMNDWKMNDFLKVVLIIQALWVFSILLNIYDIKLVLLQPILGFILFAFIPGFIIMRIMRIHGLNNIKTILYSVGLSLSLLMGIGFIIDLLYQYMGLKWPLSSANIIIIFNCLLLILLTIAYIRDDGDETQSLLNVEDYLKSPGLLILGFLPIISVIGTYLVNNYNSNLLLMLMILFMSLTVFMVSFNRLKSEHYPIVIFILSLALLFHTSLISSYLWGWDIQGEFYFTNLVLKSGFWNFTIGHNYDGILSTNILGTIFAIACNLDIRWVFKIIYPILFSLVPLGLYQVYKSQTNDKIAFFSCFFFISLVVFYMDMLQTARQQIAEIFLVLLLILLIDTTLQNRKRSILFVLFSIFLVVSHYGLSYLFMFSLIFAWLILLLISNSRFRNFINSFNSKVRFRDKKILQPIPLDNDRQIFITSTFVIFFFALTVTWYIYVASAFSMKAFLNIGHQITDSIFNDFMKTESSQSLRLIKGNVSFWHSIGKYVQLISQLSILVGFLSLVFRGNNFKYEKNFFVLSLVSILILFSCIAVPFFAGTLNTTRLYQISLIFLSPLFVIGWITTFAVLDSVIQRLRHLKTPSVISRSSFKILSLFLMIFMLFNTGFIYEVTNDNPSSISLSKPYYPLFNSEEVSAATWFEENKISPKIFADKNMWLLLGNLEFMETEKYLVQNTTAVPPGIYIMLGTFNIQTHKLLISDVTGPQEAETYIESGIFNNRSLIYDSGGGRILY
ncbi:MAG TPA: DUF2206 domain-containing protein [Methanobacteriaceae archaeon]|nr:DUF2206 domain-containing protein [Methanobacteriaceae archaeon]